jgi:hypothetical protein
MSKEATAEFNLLSHAGIDRFAAAVAHHETMNGTWPGAIPLNYKNPFAVATGGGGGSHTWARYATYTDAVKAWIQIVTDPKGPFAKTTSIKEFVHVYAPGSDGNDEAGYVATLCLILDRDVPLVGPHPTPQPTPTPTPPPPTPLDPIRVIVGGPYPPIEYGFGDDVGLSYYQYGVGHGLSRPTQHTGDDVPVPVLTPLFTPCPGKVLCVGNAGQNNWGQGCGAYPDTIGGGVGNITVLFDSGSKMTLGHCRNAVVQPGQRVSANQLLGHSSGMNGPHVHLEMTILKNGSYWLVDPAPELRKAMGAQPTPVPPPGPVPIPAGLIQKGTANHQPRTLGASMIRFLVHHITDDMNVQNAISWFQNPTSNASATFVIDRDGTTYQFMSTLVAPWTNGDYRINGQAAYRTAIPALVDAIRQCDANRYNLNEFCVTIEYVGTPENPPTDAQYVKGIELAKYVCGTYAVPPHRYGQLRHADINHITRPDCPGPHFDLTRIITALGGDPEKLA